MIINRTNMMEPVKLDSKRPGEISGALFQNDSLKRGKNAVDQIIYKMVVQTADKNVGDRRGMRCLDPKYLGGQMKRTITVESDAGNGPLKTKNIYEIKTTKVVDPSNVTHVSVDLKVKRVVENARSGLLGALSALIPRIFVKLSSIFSSSFKSHVNVNMGSDSDRILHNAKKRTKFNSKSIQSLNDFVAQQRDTQKKVRTIKNLNAFVAQQRQK